MPRDSQGTASQPFNWVQDAANGIAIEPDRHQDNDDDHLQMLTDSLDRQGRGGMQADLAMGNNKVVQVNEGTTASDAANIGQIQNGAFSYAGPDTGAANAYVVTLSPPITAYNAGLRLSFKVGAANTGPSTLQVDGVVPALPLEWNGAALVGGELPNGARVLVECDGTSFQILNVPEVLQANQGGTGTTTPLGTAAFVNTGTAIGEIPVFVDQGGQPAYPSNSGELITKVDPDITGRTVENTVDPAADALIFYDDSASENRKTVVQTVLDLVPTQIEYSWATFDNAGTLLGNQGVTSVTKNGTGDFTINFTTAWASANDYSVSGVARRTGGSPNDVIVVAIDRANAPTASSVRIITSANDGTRIDVERVTLQFIGTR